MKKLIIATLFAFGLNSFAQNKQISDRIIEKMTAELSLTAEQQASLKIAFEEQMTIRNDNKLNPANVETNKAKIKENIKKIKAILTPEQLQLQELKMLEAKRRRDAKKNK